MCASVTLGPAQAYAGDDAQASTRRRGRARLARRIRSRQRRRADHSSGRSRPHSVAAPTATPRAPVTRSISHGHWPTGRRRHEPAHTPSDVASGRPFTDARGKTAAREISSRQKAPHTFAPTDAFRSLYPYEAFKPLVTPMPAVSGRRSLGGAAAVLSIGKLTVEQSRYYERQVAQGRDDYYSGRGESPGRWTGAGTESLRETPGATRSRYAVCTALDRGRCSRRGVRDGGARRY